jgi:hypothetical protein
MANAERVCAASLAAGADNPDFAETKIATAHFFAAQVMPQTTALAKTIVAGSDPVLDLDAANF